MRVVERKRERVTEADYGGIDEIGGSERRTRLEV
jgi:hypothetical protein